MLKQLRKQDGFTLLEVLVVIAILGIIAAIITPKLTDALAESRANTAKSTGKQIQVAMERYNFQYGQYPASFADLAAFQTMLDSYTTTVTGLSWSTPTATNSYKAVGTPASSYTLQLFVNSSIRTGFDKGQCVSVTPGGVDLSTNLTTSGECPAP